MMIAEDPDTVPESELDAGFRARLTHVLDLFETRRSAAEVARKSVDQLQAYVKGRSAVPLLAVARLCAAKDVSLDWLATGQPPGPGRAPGLAEAPAGARAAPAGGQVRIPPYAGLDTARPTALRGRLSDGLTLSEAFVRDVLGCRPEGLVLVAAVGEAMAPTVAGGDLVVVDTDDRSLSDGSLYVFEPEGELLIRRVARQAGGGLRLSADHAGYADETIPPGRSRELAVVGRAVWLGCAR